MLTKDPNLEQWVRSSFRIPKARSLFEALKDKKVLTDAEEKLGVSLTPDNEKPPSSGGENSEEVPNE